MSLGTFFSKAADAIVSIGLEVSKNAYRTFRPELDYFGNVYAMVSNRIGSAKALVGEAKPSPQPKGNVQTACRAKNIFSSTKKVSAQLQTCPLSARPTPPTPAALPSPSPASPEGRYSPHVGERINADYGTKIDWSQLSSWEGHQQLAANVPWRPDGRVFSSGPEVGRVIGNSRSGVTIATGVDIGQMDERGLRQFLAGNPPPQGAASQDLVNKLVPYTNKRRQEAKDFLRANPLSISKEEADTLDNLAQRRALDQALKDFGNATAEAQRARQGESRSLPSFTELTPAQQTVLLSRAYQQGSLSGSYLSDAASGNWSAVPGDLDAMATDPSTKGWAKGRTDLEAVYLRGQ